MGWNYLKTFGVKNIPKVPFRYKHPSRWLVLVEAPRRGGNPANQDNAMRWSIANDRVGGWWHTQLRCNTACLDGHVEQVELRPATGKLHNYGVLPEDRTNEYGWSWTPPYEM